MLTLRYLDVSGERTRHIDIFVIIYEDRHEAIIFTPFQAICYNKQTHGILFCCDTIHEALILQQSQIAELLKTHDEP